MRLLLRRLLVGVAVTAALPVAPAAAAVGRGPVALAGGATAVAPAAVAVAPAAATTSAATTSAATTSAATTSAATTSATCGAELVPVASGASGPSSWFTLRNTGSTWCRTSTAPLVQLARGGRRLPVSVQPAADATARVVPPGALVSFDVRVLSRACASAASVRLALADGTTADLAGPGVGVCFGGRVAVSGFRVLLAH